MHRFIFFLPERLSRIISGGRFIGEIDGLRFLAIFPVLILHMSERLQTYSPLNFSEANNSSLVVYSAGRGFIGLYIFFVISGFVLALPFAAHYLKGARSVPIKNYFWRRLSRLAPPYILLMTFFFLALVFLRSAPFGELFPHYLASMFYVHNILFQDFTPINPVTWSLEVEVQFYILAPLLARLFFRLRKPLLRRLVLVEAIIIIIVLQQQFGLYEEPWKFSILGNLHLFLAGFLLADVYLTNWKEGIRKSWGWDIMLLIALPAPFFIWENDFFNWLLFPFLLILVVTGVFKSIFFNRFFTNKWITAIGGMCYTIYLIHLPLAELMIRFTYNLTFGESFMLNLLLQLAIFLPLTFGISVLFFLGLEKPSMDKYWPQKLGGSFKKLLCKLRLSRAETGKEGL